jgi:hypothetical protein
VYDSKPTISAAKGIARSLQKAVLCPIVLLLLHAYVAGYVSPRLSSWTPRVFHTYFYNHARRPRLEKLLYLELSRSPNGFFNHFWIQVAFSEAKGPLRNRFGSEAVTNL